jgi:threonine/homoserine/homoserine lactone efflux protein
MGSLVLAWGVGFISGLLVSIPVGPINITILNEGSRRGFHWALLIGMGSVSMEVIYCTIGFAGFAGLFESRWVRALMELSTFMLMSYLGSKYLLMHELPGTTKTEEAVEHRLHPHTAYMTGFVRVLGNPNVLLGWVALSATFIAHEWVQTTWTSRLVCISGVAVGAMVWFFFLSYLVAKTHGRFSARTLLRMSQLSGASLLVMAVVIGARLVYMLMQARH